MKILENANEIYKEKEKLDGERIRKEIHMASDLHVIFLVRGLSETRPAFLGSPPLHAIWQIHYDSSVYLWYLFGSQNDTII